MRLSKLRSIFRFNLSTLICLVFAANLVIYSNFLAKKPYFKYVYEGPNKYVRSGENYTRVTHYLVGWPVYFLAIEKQQVGKSEKNRPVFERSFRLISWQAAAQTGAVSVVLIAIYTWCLSRVVGLLTSTGRGERLRRRKPTQVQATTQVTKAN